jgi:lysyl-tRNA synthetase class 1
MLPTLGPERRATYSPFLPICPETGRVLQVPVVERHPERGTIVYEENGRKVEVPVTGGQCKVQWKADWAMRWAALGVDYEMYGKDLIPSARLSARICAIIGGTPPDGLSYELFLDEQGQKISKSRGNGLTIDEWLRYAPEESLALYMFQQPKRAKRLYFDVIPRAVDDYLGFLAAYAGQGPAERLENPVWHIHAGAPPTEDVPVSFSMLLNLVSASNSEDRGVLWGFLARYAPGAMPEGNRLLSRLVDYAIAYYHDFVKPARRYRAPDGQEAAALADLADRLAACAPDTDGEALQDLVYEIGKAHGFDPLRAWFKALYEVLLGESQGPRFGSFIALYGVRETEALIRRALAGQDLAAAG